MVGAYKFNITKTNKGYLIKSINVQGIILEAPSRDKIIDYILEALDCYFSKTEQIEHNEPKSFQLTVQY